MATTPPVSLAARLPSCLEAPSQQSLDAFLEAAQKQQLAIPDNAQFLSRARGLFAASVFAARFCQRYPRLLLDSEALARLDKPLGLADYRVQVEAVLAAAADENALTSALRLLRQQEMIRIAWRDLHALAEPAETLRNLSELAEAFIDSTLRHCYSELAERFGVPRNSAGEEQRLVALGMGKLGGLELNYSSDIDLILAFPENGETAGGRKVLDTADFYRRVVQRFVKLLNDQTADGFVFRVDLRLRPFGNSGPVAMCFDAMEAYYQTQGREWERYAMIKARAVSGEPADVEQLFSFLRPFVFRRYLDYSAFESLRELKAKISLQVKRKGMEGNVKLGAGGIREIEFIGQAFQLVRAGKETELQVRGIVPVLKLLGEKGYLPPDEVADLLSAYDFLRATENRLQMVQDAQTHVLPVQPEEQARLAYTMGFDSYADFLEVIDRHRERVHAVFDSVFQVDGSSEELPGATLFRMIWSGDLNDEEAVSELEQAGFSHPALVYEQLQQLGQGGFYSRLTNTARQRLDTIVPPVLQAASETVNPDDTAARLLGLLRRIAGRSVYLQVLIENPPSLALLVRLFSASRWLADFVTASPMVIDEVLDHRLIDAVPDQTALEAEMQAIIARVQEEELDVQMDAVRQFRQANVMRVIVADIEGYLPLKQVSNCLTAIAEVVLQGATALVQQAMRERHGVPCYELDGQTREAGFAVIGYGKLGGYELGYGSDLDVVFLHDSQGSKQQSNGAKPLDNSVYFARLAQKLISFLQITTPAGTLYEVDTRLRPNGQSGLLVSSLAAFADYQEQKAWTWEHQSLVRARMIVGSEALGEGFRRVRHTILSRCRERDQLRNEVTEMRERMCRELSKGTEREFDLKQDRGGIVDIEFMVQYSVLAHACDHPALTDWTDNLRIIDTLAEAGFLTGEQAARIMEVYFTYRGHTHTQALQGVNKHPVPLTDEIKRCRDDILALWTHLVENDGVA
ncbi:bifunctional [glutamate--ammonia ligase]-adenylyl-L-tyrosine phosphorylase/[glutamate--ammonia-ligase] adenylyltransferase [Granulosicoccaceae sp. 1_MG-2023]|nr:bifunctional [glutamate--ammonia ligase]-adenylyl-L-tyrosine phosphorylase/[glutamate--ammonia-ligase] adenylyltransferase [Granulosicoccaceae sp. 1_MG-2023]